jgi:D-tagatose-1,6-bisphosphate aldolase subunit GatZ/KbaZ
MRLADIFQNAGDSAPTLLGIGPMSSTVVRAGLRAAAETGAPVAFIASRNQVESAALGGGYVEGWDQAGLADYVASQAQRWRGKARWFLGRDHGGPWQRDDEYHARLPWPAARDRALRSLRDDIDAGFHYLHIDAAKDPFLGDDIPVDLGVHRIVELMHGAESHRLSRGLPSIDYEVSLEKANGQVTPAAEFDHFLAALVAELGSHGLPTPLFAVANTGTWAKLDRNVGEFRPDAARRLAAVARRHGLVFKEHNADYLADADLRVHTRCGIGMANVAPEFGHAETAALLHLAAMESVGAPPLTASGIASKLAELVMRSGRAAKWLHGDSVDPHVVVKIGAHYFFSDQEIGGAREALYANIRACVPHPDPEQLVEDRVMASIRRYIDIFADSAAAGNAAGASATGEGTVRAGTSAYASVRPA